MVKYTPNSQGMYRVNWMPPGKPGKIHIATSEDSFEDLNETSILHLRNAHGDTHEVLAGDVTFFPLWRK